MKIGTISVVLVVLVLCFLFVANSAIAQTCRWDGASPWCNGSCGGGETEVTRVSSIPDFWVAPYVNVSPPFGAACVLGSKALCCSSPSYSCRWDGTAPFCDGSCKAGETPGSPPAGSSSGMGCWTGSKKYCCRSASPSAVPGTVRMSLSIASVRSGAGKCLDVNASAQKNNGATVQVWGCNGQPQQSWMLVDNTIRSQAGKCLDVHAPDQYRNGGRVQVWDCNGSKQQTWAFDGKAIRSAAGKCLDVHAPDQYKNGGRVQVWDCNGSLQQSWKVQ